MRNAMVGLIMSDKPMVTPHRKYRAVMDQAVVHCQSVCLAAVRNQKTTLEEQEMTIIKEHIKLRRVIRGV